MVKTILIVFAVLWVIGTVMFEAGGYGPWSDETQIAPTRAMVQHGVGGCPEIQFRQHSGRDATEWQARCRRMADDPWRYYLVFTATGKVMGPYPSESAIP